MLPSCRGVNGDSKLPAAAKQEALATKPRRATHPPHLRAYAVDSRPRPMKKLAYTSMLLLGCTIRRLLHRGGPATNHIEDGLRNAGGVHANGAACLLLLVNPAQLLSRVLQRSRKSITGLLSERFALLESFLLQALMVVNEVCSHAPRPSGRLGHGISCLARRGGIDIHNRRPAFANVMLLTPASSQAALQSLGKSGAGNVPITQQDIARLRVHGLPIGQSISISQSASPEQLRKPVHCLLCVNRMAPGRHGSSEARQLASLHSALHLLPQAESFRSWCALWRCGDFGSAPLESDNEAS